MTRDDVIRMAREAGGHELARIDGAQDSVVAISGNDAIMRFAALVAAHEREECAKAAKKAIFQMPTDERQSGDLLEHYICSSIRTKR